MALENGGAGFLLFSSTVFKYLSGTEPSPLVATIEEVGDPGVHQILLKVNFLYFYK